MRISVALVLTLAACASAPPPPPPPRAAIDYQALVTATDRDGDDRSLDFGRKPVEFLHALQVKPGMKTGELFCGGGYTTELLARAVAPGGKVYGENPKWVLDKMGAKWNDRLAKKVNANVVREDAELEDPFPGLANQLDLVVMNANYHDTVAMKTDRAKMNAAVLAALKPGGFFVVADSSARAGSGISDSPTLHRIDEATVRAELESAGFHYDSSDDSLRNPADTRDWNASPGAAGAKRGTSDRFILRFVKPAR